MWGVRKLYALFNLAYLPTHPSIYSLDTWNWSSILYNQEIAKESANSILAYSHSGLPSSVNVLSAKKDSLGFWGKSKIQLISDDKKVLINTILKNSTFNENQFNPLNYLKEPFLIKRDIKRLLGLSPKVKNKAEAGNSWKLVEIVTDDVERLNEILNLNNEEDDKLVKITNSSEKSIISRRSYLLLLLLGSAVATSSIYLIKYTISYRSTLECINYVKNIAMKFHNKGSCFVKRTEGTIKDNYFDGKVYLSDDTCLKIIACRSNRSDEFMTHLCKRECPTTH